MNQHRYPIEDHELPEFLQQVEDDANGPPVWSLRRRVMLMVCASLLLWAIVILAAIGGAALLGYAP